MTRFATMNRTTLLLTVIAGFLWMPQLAIAQDAINAPAKKQIGGAKTEMVRAIRSR